MVSLDLIWWIVFARLTNHTAARIIVSIFMAAMVIGLIAVIAARMSRGDWDRLIPKFGVTAIVIWHSVGLGLLSLIALALIPILLVQKIVRLARHTPSAVTRSVEAAGWYRRAFFCFISTMFSPGFTFASTAFSQSPHEHLLSLP